VSCCGGPADSSRIVDRRSQGSSATLWRGLVGGLTRPKVARDRLGLLAYFHFIRTLISWRLAKTAFGKVDSSGLEIRSLAAPEPGRGCYLDYFCNCTLDTDNSVGALGNLGEC